LNSFRIVILQSALNGKVPIWCRLVSFKKSKAKWFSAPFNNAKSHVLSFQPLLCASVQVPHVFDVKMEINKTTFENESFSCFHFCSEIINQNPVQRIYFNTTPSA
jgi:hypothetical protein